MTPTENFWQDRRVFVTGCTGLVAAAQVGLRGSARLRWVPRAERHPSGSGRRADAPFSPL